MRDFFVALFFVVLQIVFSQKCAHIVIFVKVAKVLVHFFLKQNLKKGKTIDDDDTQLYVC